jgi:hypothetical protein
MSLPIQRRDFDVFLSHAHKDAAFVAQLHLWLTTAGLRVWYDARELAGGALLATDLQAAIERCRGILLVASEESLARGWVKAEYNSAMDLESDSSKATGPIRPQRPEDCGPLCGYKIRNILKLGIRK